MTAANGNNLDIIGAIALRLSDSTSQGDIETRQIVYICRDTSDCNVTSESSMTATCDCPRRQPPPLPPKDLPFPAVEDNREKLGQGHEHVCHTGMPVRNGNLGTDRNTTTKAASVRKQLGTQNSKSNKGRQAKNGGVKGRDGSAEELDRETGEEQITVGWTRRKDGG